MSAGGGRVRERWLRWPRWVRWPVLAGGGLLLLGVLFFVFLWFTVDLPDEPPELQSAVLVAADGRSWRCCPGGAAVEVPLEVVPVVLDALLAAEDRRFYEHGGIDPVGIGRALWRTCDVGTQGGSTITQQLVKNEYLDQRAHARAQGPGGRARDEARALRGQGRDPRALPQHRLLRPRRLRHRGGRPDYFGSTAAELELDQAALLVGLLRSPETADPAEDMDEATRRARRARRHGRQWTRSPRGGGRRRRQPIEATDQHRARRAQAGLAPHFVEWVREQAIDAVGEDAIYGAGLRVVTTLDLAPQRRPRRRWPRSSPTPPTRRPPSSPSTRTARSAPTSAAATTTPCRSTSSAAPRAAARAGSRAPRSSPSCSQAALEDGHHARRSLRRHRPHRGRRRRRALGRRQLRRRGLRRASPSPTRRELGQHRLRAAPRRGRTGGGRRDGPRDGHRRRAGPGAVDRPRRRGGQPARPRQRLPDLRRRRHAVRALRHRPDRGPRRQRACGSPTGPSPRRRPSSPTSRAPSPTPCAA